MDDEPNQEPSSNDPEPASTQPNEAELDPRAGDWIERNSTRFSSAPGIPSLGQGKLAEGEEKTWGMMCHLAALANLLGPSLLNIVGPLVPWLIKRQESPWVDAHGKESLNFQLTMSIIAWIGGMAMPFTCGVSVVVTLLAAALSIVMPIIASVRANEGKFMAYPFAFRFFR